MIEQTLFIKLFKQEKLARAATSDSEAKRWGPTRGGISAYSNTFENVLGGQKIEDFLGDKKDRPVIAADLMGYGWILSELPINYGLAVAHTDLDFEQIPKNPDKTIDILSGNIASKKTWRQIADWLKKIPGNNKFNLILCRPAALDASMIPDDINLYYYLIQQAWSILDNDDGVILTQVPRDADEITQKWVHLLNESGITARYSSVEEETGKVKSELGTGKLMLQKTKNSPESLPILNINK